MSKTQKSVARVAGVSQSAVSLALRGSPEVSAALRERIRKIARRIGYRPIADAQRMAARKAGKTPQGAVLAWINREVTEDFWTGHPISRAYWRGASRQAFRMGYGLDAFWLHEPGMTARRLAEILHHRGIEGVVFPGYSSSVTAIDRDVWKRFAAVSLNHPVSPSVVDHVCADFPFNMDLCMQRLLKERPLRIGLVLKDVFDSETAFAARARFLFHAASAPVKFRIPPLIVPDIPGKKVAHLRGWLHEWKPEVVVARDYEIAAAVKACSHGGKSPRIIQLQLNEMTRGCSGIDEKNEKIGAAAIELLGGKLLHGKYPLSPCFRTLLIKGEWRGGRF